MELLNTSAQERIFGRCQNLIECSLRNRRQHLRCCRGTAASGSIFCDRCTASIDSILAQDYPAPLPKRTAV